MESFFTLSILLALVTFNGIINVAVAQGPSFNALFQFGDSVTDTGNDVVLNGNTGCGAAPYGQTFFKHPTGRCSDGRLIVDFFADALKLPHLTPSMDKSGVFTQGANFAIAGATAITTSATSLPNQLASFKSQICPDPAACKQKLANALFVVGEIGGNDYNGPAWGGKTPDDLRSSVPGVIQAISGVVSELIDLGATKLVVPGNFAVGCLTVYLTKFKSNDPTMYDEIGCLKNWNDFVSYHNTQLQGAIKTLQGQHPGVKIVYADYFNALKSVFQNAASLGFDEPNKHKACCGAGGDLNFGGPYCGSSGATVCPDPSARVSWDGIHLTEHAYQVIAGDLLKQVLPALS